MAMNYVMQLNGPGTTMIRWPVPHPVNDGSAGHLLGGLLGVTDPFVMHPWLFLLGLVGGAYLASKKKKR